MPGIVSTNPTWNTLSPVIDSPSYNFLTWAPWPTWPSSQPSKWSISMSYAGNLATWQTHGRYCWWKKSQTTICYSYEIVGKKGYFDILHINWWRGFTMVPFQRTYWFSWVAGYILLSVLFSSIRFGLVTLSPNMYSHPDGHGRYGYIYIYYIYRGFACIDSEIHASERIEILGC